MGLAVEQWDDRVEWRFVAPRSMTVGALVNELADAVMVGMLGAFDVALTVGLTWWALASDERASLGEGVSVVVWFVGGLIILMASVLMGRPAWQQLRRSTDTIRIDSDGVWASRYRWGGRRRHRRLAWSQISGAWLAGDGGPVLVGTVDGREHLLTDLGTVPQRVAVATALRAGALPALIAQHRHATLAEELADADPAGPGQELCRLPQMPPGWRIRPADEPDTIVLWRRVGRWRAWLLATVTIAAVMAAADQARAAATMPRPWVGVAMVVAVAVVGALVVAAELSHVTAGWQLRTGRLVETRVRARTGRAVDPTGRPVTSLALIAPSGRGLGRYRLAATLGGGETRHVYSSTRRHRLYRFATWLAVHADLRLDQTVRGATTPVPVELPRAAATT